jgi:hypothetical protein
MKYLKMLGLAAIAAGALMAFVGAGTASATELTCTNPPGTKVMCPEPTHIHAEVHPGTKVVLDPPFGSIECSASTVTFYASTGSSTTTPTSVNSKGESGELETLTFGSCNATVTVVKSGRLEIHTTEALPNHNGILTSTGAKVTVEFIGTHCIFETNNTTIGHVTGSSTTGGMPTLDISATIPRVGGRSGAFCGEKASWTGGYTITTPEWLDVDN